MKCTPWKNKYTGCERQHYLSYSEPITIEVGIFQRQTGMEERAALKIIASDTPVLYDAMQAIKTNDSILGTIIDGMPDIKVREIKHHRKVISKEIAEHLTQYLLENMFGKNDTHNGYTKEER